MAFIEPANHLHLARNDGSKPVTRLRDVPRRAEGRPREQAGQAARGLQHLTGSRTAPSNEGPARSGPSSFSGQLSPRPEPQPEDPPLERTVAIEC